MALKPAGHPLQTLISHRNLVATRFPRSVTAAAAYFVEDKEEMFHCVASQGVLSSVLALLSDGRFSSDLPDRFGRTPLHWAAEQGHHNVVLALLRAGACVDPRSQCNATPLMLAATRGHADVVGLLLQYHAGLSDCWSFTRHSRGIEHWRTTALHCAAAGGHVRVVEALLDAGFHRGQHDGAGLTPAEVSARQSHYTSAAITHLLLPTSDMGGKLVHDYVNMAMQDVAMVSGLVKGGASLDWRDGTGDTPLHRAAHFHHATISRILLQAGADPNIRDHRGVSPLHIAASTGCGEIVADLLEAGADLEHRDAIHGQTSLSSACEGCFAAVVHALVEAGADVESRCAAGVTPLHWACRFNDAESVEVLLNAGADPCAVDRAAADAVAASSSRSDTIVSMPVAIDVIGLGYLFHRMGDSRRLSVALAARRLDLASVRRIGSALKAAQQEKSWRRRGWLVVLESRRASVDKVGAGGERRAVHRRGYCSSPVVPAATQSRRVDTIVTHSPCAHQQEADTYRRDFKANNELSANSDSSDSCSVRAEWSDGSILVGKRSRCADNVVPTATATSRRRNQPCGGIGAQARLAAPSPGVVGALLELAAVEAGLFRRVVVFV